MVENINYYIWFNEYVRYYSYSMTYAGQQLVNPSGHFPNSSSQHQDPQQSSASKIDLVQQSITAAGVAHDFPTSSTSNHDGNGSFGDIGINLDAPLSPSRDDSPPSFDNISPVEQLSSHDNHHDQRHHGQLSHRSHHGQLSHRSHHQSPGPSHMLQTPQHPSTADHDSRHSGIVNQHVSDQHMSGQHVNDFSDQYSAMAHEIELTLPLLEDFNYVQTDPSATKSRVAELVSALRSGLDELGAIGASKGDTEETCSSLHAALLRQRQCVRSLRDKCRRVSIEYKDSDENIRSLEMSQLKLKLKQQSSVIAQLEATIATKDGEIKLLKEYLRRSDFKSPKGKSLASSKNPYPKRSFATANDLVSGIETPRRSNV